MKEKNAKIGKTIFVSVGTTYFDELIDVCLGVPFLKEAKKLFYDRIVIQCGHYKGELKPHLLETLQSRMIVATIKKDTKNKDFINPHTLYEEKDGEFHSKHKEFPSTLSIYRFKPSLAEDQEAADLIISHGGAGCIFEALNLKKPLMVVANHSLADNHQDELAMALQDEKHLIRCPSTHHVILKLKNIPSLLKTLKPLQKPNMSSFKKIVHQELYS